MGASKRALDRIRDEMRERSITQRDLAERMQCSQGKIAKLLNARMNLRLEDLATMADAVGLTLTETVRDRGLEFYAEMAPTEVRILERLRQRPEAMHALLTLLDITDVTKNVVPKKKVGRPTDSSRIKTK